MHAQVTISTGFPRAALEPRLAKLTAGGPFRMRDLAHVGGGVWTFAIQPQRPGLSIGFAKFAELLVLLAREFHIDAVEHFATGAATVGSAVAAAERRPPAARAS
jgi:hypothetical protein